MTIHPIDPSGSGRPPEYTRPYNWRKQDLSCLVDHVQPTVFVVFFAPISKSLFCRWRHEEESRRNTVNASTTVCPNIDACSVSIWWRTPLLWPNTTHKWDKRAFYQSLPQGGRGLSMFLMSALCEGEHFNHKVRHYCRVWTHRFRWDSWAILA